MKLAQTAKGSKLLTMPTLPPKLVDFGLRRQAWWASLSASRLCFSPQPIRSYPLIGGLHFAQFYYFPRTKTCYITGNAAPNDSFVESGVCQGVNTCPCPDPCWRRHLVIFYGQRALGHSYNEHNDRRACDCSTIEAS